MSRSWKAARPTEAERRQAGELVLERNQAGEHELKHSWACEHELEVS